MSKLTGQDATIKIDDAAGSLTEITTTLNSFSISSSMDTIEVSDLGDDEKESLSGLAGATFSMNGFWDSTANSIFGPLINNRTTITKTVQFDDGTNFYSGEVWVTDVSPDASVNQAIVFSGGGEFNGAITKSSKSL